MSCLGNILWLISGGLISGLIWYLTGIVMFCTIIGIPWARACFVMGNFALMPFGREAISRRTLRGEDDIGTSALGLLGNVVWFLCVGLWLALSHAVAALICAVTIIGIPFAIQHLKLGSLALFPIGQTVVSKEIAQAARAAEAEAYVEAQRRY